MWGLVQEVTPCLPKDGWDTLQYPKQIWAQERAQIENGWMDHYWGKKSPPWMSLCPVHLCNKMSRNPEVCLYVPSHDVLLKKYLFHLSYFFLLVNCNSIDLCPSTSFLFVSCSSDVQLQQSAKNSFQLNYSSSGNGSVVWDRVKLQAGIWLERCNNKQMIWFIK